MTSQIIYGWHSIIAALKSSNTTITTLYLTDSRKPDKKTQEAVALAEKLSLQIVELPRQEFDKKFPDINHQGVVAVTIKHKNYEESDLNELLARDSATKIILILDGVTDPHNLGACLRTADAAGVSVVLAPKDRNVGITPTVRKVACGAAETVPFIQVTNLARTISQLQQDGVWIYGAAGEADTSLYKIVFPKAVALILGAEDKGLRRLTREHCDELFSIPMQGSVSSLNVSVATGVCLFEIVRQHQGMAHGTHKHK